MTTESPNPRTCIVRHSVGFFPLLARRKMAEEERELSEQEERVWEEKKRMRERISSIMGQYLLKGYRMLNVNCAECGVHSPT